MKNSSWRFFSTVLLASVGLVLGATEPPTDGEVLSLAMPDAGAEGPTRNGYRCKGIQVPYRDTYIVKYEPRVNADVIHHLLVFGCPSQPTFMRSQTSWNCKSNAFLCSPRESPKIVFAWALNASGLQLPEKTGFEIGTAVDIGYFVVQVHYGHTLDNQAAGNGGYLNLRLTQNPTLYTAGIYLLGSGSPIPAKSSEASVYTACEFHGTNPIYPFAFRTHAHSLGKQILGYVVKGNNDWQLIGTRSPQDPQAFYPAAGSIEVLDRDWLALRCIFDTSQTDHNVHMGANIEDEMCNLYVMYYTLNTAMPLFPDACWSPAPSWLHYPTPSPLTPSTHHHHHEDGEEGEEENEEDDYICPNPVPPGKPSDCTTKPTTSSVQTTPPITQATPTQSKATPTTTQSSTLPTTSSVSMPTEPRPPLLIPAEDWPLNTVEIPPLVLGQVSAVAIDNQGFLSILHRGSHTWDATSFSADNHYQGVSQGPIPVPTVLRFHSNGKPNHAWGEYLFYIPHGLTIDHHGNYWITDVAMHQVFKFAPSDELVPALSLGEAFKPGSSHSHFCKPTSVAVLTSGEFFVADGYCNHRVSKFSPEGTLIAVWDQPVAGLYFNVPHKLFLSSAQDQLFLADRENRRVVTLDPALQSADVFAGPLDGGRVFAIGRNGSSDWPLYGVFGGGGKGFLLGKDGALLGDWGPEEGFARAHDLVVDSANGAVYVSEIGPNMIWKFSLMNSSPEVVSHDLDALLLPPTTETTPTSSESDSELDFWEELFRGHMSKATPTNTEATPTNNLTTPTNHHRTVATDTKATTASGLLPEVPYRGTNTSQADTDAVESSDNADSGAESSDSNPFPVKNFGVFIAILVVAILIVLVAAGVLKEHGSFCFRRGTRKVEVQSLHSLLGPSQLGFSRLRTYDSDSEAEEFPVFNRV